VLPVQITGNQLRAGGALAALSMEDLAARARLSRRTLSKWGEAATNRRVRRVLAPIGLAVRRGHSVTGALSWTSQSAIDRSIHCACA